jgi:predicted RNase H-like HicB family nuclease
MKKRHVLKFQVIIEQDEDGLYVATCPSLQGCYTQGRTFEEVTERIRDVIALCLEELREEGKPIPRPGTEFVGLKYVEVAG